MNIRFLTENEYAATASLFTECFGFDEEFMEEFYGSENTDGSVSGVIKDGIIAAAEDDTGFIAMVQVIYKTAVPLNCDNMTGAPHDPAAENAAGGDDVSENTACENCGAGADSSVDVGTGMNSSSGSSAVSDKETTGYRVPYIMGVCTLPEYRHRGLMDRLMTLAADRLKAEGYPWCFLIAVNKDIYRHLGFTYDWKLSERECELLYADDGLDTASGKLLNADSIGRIEVF